MSWEGSEGRMCWEEGGYDALGGKDELGCEGGGREGWYDECMVDKARKDI